MERFSNIQISFDNWIKEAELEKLSLGFKLESFTGKEATPAARKKRLEVNKKDFWAFDKNYFPPDLYENYAEPSAMLKKIPEVSVIPGMHLFIGPRKHGKTVDGKKVLVWLLLTGLINSGGTYAETLLKSSKILRDVFLLINQNERIKFDYKFEVISANADEFQLKMIEQKKPIRTCAAFSEGRSVRGYTTLFTRPQFLLGDDIETLESSFTAAAVQLRISKLLEAYHSMNDNAVFLILANDFSLASAVHQIRYEADNNLLPEDWHVYVYQAFAKVKTKLQDKGVLWKERYKVKTEAELKKILKPKSESDWQTGFQENPTPPEGDYFKRKHYSEYFSLPKDVRGIIYTDPNLSKKGKGNTTAIVPLLYSPSEELYFIPAAVCKSFSDSNLLLDSLIELKTSTGNIVAFGFDGNVTQESTWTQHVRNYCKIKGVPFPTIEYKKYRVNDLAKNLQLDYEAGKIKFAPSFSKTVDGETFLTQFFSFSGEKKEGGADDAPDSLICAFEFIHERRIVKRAGGSLLIAIKDYYQL